VVILVASLFHAVQMMIGEPHFGTGADFTWDLVEGLDVINATVKFNVRFSPYYELNHRTE